MFQTHSFLWHYLWVAPNVLLGVLAAILWKRKLHKKFRSFWVFAVFEFAQWLLLYPMDLLPWFSSETFWRVYRDTEMLESVLVFLLISDIFANVFGQYEALARFGKLLIRGGGALFIVTAAGAAAFAPAQNRFLPIQDTHVLEEAMYIVVSGMVLLLFASAAYFRLAWPHKVYGIALGLGFSSCIHLAAWAISANRILPETTRNTLDLIDMATTHIAVLIWLFYLLIPEKVRGKQLAVSLPENNLAVWNRELERLLQL